MEPSHNDIQQTHPNGLLSRLIIRVCLAGRITTYLGAYLDMVKVTCPSLSTFPETHKSNQIAMSTYLCSSNTQFGFLV